MARPARLLASLSLLVAACGFFKELQSADSATDGGSDGSDGTASSSDGTASETAASCEVLPDDACIDQDDVRSCDPASGEITEVSCIETCGENVNFSCIRATSDGQHGCWCVVPGAQKVLACWELSDCLQGCVGAEDAACSDQCFTRTTRETIRTFGTLVNCAHASCEDTCDDTPEDCSACIDAAISGVTAACTLEKAVCDGDQNDDPWFPG